MFTLSAEDLVLFRHLVGRDVNLHVRETYYEFSHASAEFIEGNGRELREYALIDDGQYRICSGWGSTCYGPHGTLKQVEPDRLLIENRAGEKWYEFVSVGPCGPVMHFQTAENFTARIVTIVEDVNDHEFHAVHLDRPSWDYFPSEQQELLQTSIPIAFPMPEDNED